MPSPSSWPAAAAWSPRPSPIPGQPRPARTARPGPACHWAEDRLGRRYIRGECARCSRWLANLSQVEPYTSQANARASSTAVLDVLVRLEDLGIELQSDGQAVSFGKDWQRVPDDLRTLVRQCSHQLAGLLGKR